MPGYLKLVCFAVIWTAVCFVATLVIANLSRGNKPIDEPLQRLYSVDSSEFRWVMGCNALTL